jgi:hypothetical protein
MNRSVELVKRKEIENLKFFLLKKMCLLTRELSEAVQDGLVYINKGMTSKARVESDCAGKL